MKQVEDYRSAISYIQGEPGVDPERIDSNIVIVPVKDGHAAEATLVEHGVRCVAISPTEIRLVTHRDVGDDDVERAAACAHHLRH